MISVRWKQSLRGSKSFLFMLMLMLLTLLMLMPFAWGQAKIQVWESLISQYLSGF